MLDAVKNLLGLHTSESGDAPEATTLETDPAHVAACALVLEVAHADGAFTGEERAHLQGVLERHFDLPADSGQRLLELAETARRESVDYYQFTSTIRKSYDLGQKMVLAEVMWGMVLADGKIAREERYLTRKIANLLDLKPGYLSRAKRAAAEGSE
ncbi:MAG: TerB family tellurite resistance protein [Candidatus Palauibacterales bacterium]|nr:TerB family tellurite resistance protein [Candidatus Palauibacterales bacterium]